MKLSDISYYVDDNISSDCIELYQYITTDNLLQNKEGRTVASNLPPKACSLTRFLPGDVLIANIRPYLKKVWKADIEGGCSKDVLVIRPKEGHDADYLYSVALQDVFFDNAMLGNKGTQMPRGDKNKIMDFPILEQTDKEVDIGKIISDIQEKISLNTRMNAELEAMAKQLYDYWFVQFDFPFDFAQGKPDENGRPYKSSGGKMVWNEKLKREIPEGWEDATLSEIANITMGQSPDGSTYNTDGIGMVFYQGSTDFGIRFPSVRMFTTNPTRFASKGDILMSVRAPVGDTNIANENCCIGRGLSALNSKIGSTTHLYHILGDLKAKFDQLNAAGTTFGSITKDEMYSLPVVKPSSEVLKSYEDICFPMFEKQMNIGYEIYRLTRLRDSLLPMLMNGQVEVKSNEISNNI